MSRRAIRSSACRSLLVRRALITPSGVVTTQQFAAPTFNNLESTKASSNFGSDVKSASGEFTFSDFLNIFLFNQKLTTSGAMIRALKGRGLFPEPGRAEPDCA